MEISQKSIFTRTLYHFPTLSPSRHRAVSTLHRPTACYDYYVLPTNVKIYATRIGAGLTAALLLAAAIGVTDNYFILRFGIMCCFFVLALYFLLQNYRQLALAFVVGGIIFNPYLTAHLARQIWVILDMVAIFAVAYAAYWATNPYKKGTRFEDYVATLFPEPEFVVQNRTRDISKHTKRIVESDTHPDFEFRASASGKVFAVECKWRAHWAYQINGGQGIWWNLNQFDRYSAFQQRTGMPVYVAFGIGGTPEKPKEVYFLELDRLRFPFLYRSLIKSGKSARDLQ